MRQGEDDLGRGGIERELRRGSLELVLLRLLRDGEAYGYQIVTAVAERTRGQLVLAEGTLYPVLHRLEKQGLVQIRWDTPERGVPRKYYRLSPAGTAELAQLTSRWLAFTGAITDLLTTAPDEEIP